MDNMVEISSLKARISEKGTSIKVLAKEIGLDQSTFYRKMRADGMTFTVKEVTEIAKVLDLSGKELSDIFFHKNSHISK